MIHALSSSFSIIFISQARIHVYHLLFLTHLPFTQVNHPISAHYPWCFHSSSILPFSLSCPSVIPAFHTWNSACVLESPPLHFLSFVLTSVLAPSSNLLLDILVAVSPDFPLLIPLPTVSTANSPLLHLPHLFLFHLHCSHPLL